MKTLLYRLWMDENFFLRCGAFVVMYLGKLVESGQLPTYVDGLGPKLGPVVIAAAAAVAVGKIQAPKKH